MSAPGTPKASEAAVAAVQDALIAHQPDGFISSRDQWVGCTCGEHLPCVIEQALRDAATAWSVTAVQEFMDFANERYEVGGPDIPVLWLRHRADRIEAGQ